MAKKKDAPATKPRETMGPIVEGGSYDGEGQLIERTNTDVVGPAPEPEE